MWFLTPPARGGQNTKIATALERVARSFRRLGETFKCVFGREWHPSRAVALMFPTSGNTDAILPLFGSHTWYFCSFILELCSHVFHIYFSRLMPPEWSLQTLGPRALPPLCRVQICFWIIPTAISLCRKVWDTYFYLFNRDPAYFDAYKVCIPCSISIFH
jgi:hypothetical protein